MASRWRAAPPPAGFLRGTSRLVNIHQSRLCLSRDPESQRRSHSSLAGMLATIKKVKERLGTARQTTTADWARSNLPNTRGQKTHLGPPTGSPHLHQQPVPQAQLHQLHSAAAHREHFAPNRAKGRSAGGQSRRWSHTHSITRAPLSSTPLHALIMPAQAKNRGCVSSSDWSPVEAGVRLICNLTCNPGASSV